MKSFLISPPAATKGHQDPGGLARTEAAVRESEKRLRTIFETEPECVMLLGRDGRFLEMNPAGLAMFGAGSLDEVRERKLSEFVAPEFHAALRSLLEKVFEGGSGRLEFQLIQSSGTNRWLETMAAPLREDSGKVSAVLGVSRDITARKSAEVELLASKERFRDIFTFAPLGIYQALHDGTILTANPALAEMLGYASADELLKINLNKDVFGHPEERLRMIRDFAGPGYAVDLDLRWKRKDGSLIDIQLSAHAIKRPDGSTEYFEGFARDITERKKAANALREKEFLLSESQRIAHIGSWRWDLEETVTWTEESYRIYGVLPERFKPTLESVLNIIHRDDQPAVRQWVQKCRDGETSYDVEYRVIQRDGSVRWLRARGKLIDDANGRPSHMSGTVQDITARRQTEAAADRGMRELRVLYEASLIFSQSRAPRTVAEHIIATMEQLLDYERGSIWVKQRHSSELAMLAHSDLGLKGDALEAEMTRIRTLVAQSHGGISGWVAQHGESVRTGAVKQDPRYAQADPAIQSELCVPLKVGGRTVGAINVESSRMNAFTESDERLLTTLANQAGVAIENARLFQDLEADITERKKVEAALEESGIQLRALLARLRRAREEERTRVSREIHDELGQLLTGLKMDMRWLERKLSEPGLPGLVNPLLDRAVQASELADATIAAVQRIAAELRPGTLEKLGLDASLSQEARRFQERSGIQCIVKIEEPRPYLPAETANELFYICQEALTNVARHSGARRVEIRLKPDADAVTLEVCDDGAGMPGGVLRAPGSLGVIGMRERAAQCGGTISFERNLPQGTRVMVRLPCLPALIGEKAGH